MSVTGRASQAGGRGFREEKGSGGPGRGGGSQEAGVLWASLGAGGVFSAWSQVGSRDKTQGHCESPTCPGHWEPTLQRLCQLPALSQDSPPASCGPAPSGGFPGCSVGRGWSPGRRLRRWVRVRFRVSSGCHPSAHSVSHACPHSDPQRRRRCEEGGRVK